MQWQAINEQGSRCGIKGGGALFKIERYLGPWLYSQGLFEVTANAQDTSDNAELPIRRILRSKPKECTSTKICNLEKHQLISAERCSVASPVSTRRTWVDDTDLLPGAGVEDDSQQRQADDDDGSFTLR